MTSSTARADARIPAAHPFARHLARARAAEPHAAWTPDDGALPALYLSHGAPPVFEDEGWMALWHGWARSLPRPRAVLIVSAHWESSPLSLSRPTPGGELVYDFGGFDPLYGAMRYDTPDASELARQVVSVLPDTERVHVHPSRGLDHGAWVPLKVMYPEADVPVLQLSIPTSDSTRLLELGARLRVLRESGVLVVGEHFTPLFVTLGAATDPEAPVTTTIDGFFVGLAKRSFQAA